MSDSFLSTVRERINRLKELDADRVQFGARSHEHRLGPPLSEAECDQIERAYGISLPEDYRSFITTVGNGGAGPGYGLERFVAAESKSKIPVPRFARSERPTVVRFGREYPGPVQHFDEAGNVIDPWEFRYFDLAALYAPDGEFGRESLRQPFPYTAPISVDALDSSKLSAENWAEEIRSQVRQNLAAFKDHAIVLGALRLCHFGCNINGYLILNGPFRGEVWVHDPSCGYFVPASMKPGLTFVNAEENVESKSESEPQRWNFSQWHDRWLAHELQNIHKEYTPEAIAGRREARAQFERLHSLKQIPIASGEVDGIHYRLSRPADEPEK